MKNGKAKFSTQKKVKTVIIVILTLAAVLFSVPFLQDFYTCYVKSTTSVKYVSKLPKVIQPAETIHAPTLQTVMNMNTHARTAVGRVVMPSIGLDDDIYAGLTNENLFLWCRNTLSEQNGTQAQPGVDWIQYGAYKGAFRCVGGC